MIVPCSSLVTTGHRSSQLRRPTVSDWPGSLRLSLSLLTSRSDAESQQKAQTSPQPTRGVGDTCRRGVLTKERDSQGEDPRTFEGQDIKEMADGKSPGKDPITSEGQDIK